jgi:hypothetical protein
MATCKYCKKTKLVWMKVGRWFLCEPSGLQHVCGGPGKVIVDNRPPPPGWESDGGGCVVRTSKKFK